MRKVASKKWLGWTEGNKAPGGMSGVPSLPLGGRNKACGKPPRPPFAGILKEHLAGLGLVVGARRPRCKKGQAKHTLSVYIGCA